MKLGNDIDRDVKSTRLGARLRTLFQPTLLAVAVLIAVACASTNETVKRLEVAGADAQRAIALAYNDAKVQNATAGKACGDEARARGITISTFEPGNVDSGEHLMKACAAVERPLLFNPVKLNQLVGPINALKGSIEGLDSARKAALAGGQGDLGGFLAKAITAAKSFYAAAKEAGWDVKIPTLDTFLAKGATP